MPLGPFIENCVIYVCITACVLGCYALGFGGVGWYSLLLLFFVNFVKVKS